jgi:RimJ/RimL family protein N-acetyltransferase
MFKVIKANLNEHLENIVDFQLKMAKETENLELNKEIVTKGVTAVFEDSSKGQYYVCLKDGICIGSLLTVSEWSDWRCKSVVWIHSVYIVESMRGQKVFKEMYNYLKSEVQESQSLAGLRLYVDKTNTKAQKVYQKIGMSNEHYELYEWLK